MTRKDYILIANALKEIRTSYENPVNNGLSLEIRRRVAKVKFDALDAVTINLACHLCADNPAFDLELFKTASGM